MSKNQYTSKGLLLNFIWRIVIPGFFIWFIPFLIDNKIIDEKRDDWAVVVLVPMMVVLIIGTGINFLYMIYYLIKVLTSEKKQE